MASGQVTVTSSNHHNDLVAGLWALLLEKRGVDVEVGWGGRYVAAHGLLLEVFQLSQYKLSAAQRQLRTDDCRMLEALLEFAYTGRVTVAGEQLYVLLAVARAVDFRLLVDALQDVIQKNIETGIAVKVEPSSDIEICDDSQDPTSKSLLVTSGRKDEFFETNVTEPTKNRNFQHSNSVAHTSEVLVKQEQESQNDRDDGIVGQEIPYLARMIKIDRNVLSMCEADEAAVLVDSNQAEFLIPAVFDSQQNRTNPFEQEPLGDPVRGRHGATENRTSFLMAPQADPVIERSDAESLASSLTDNSSHHMFDRELRRISQHLDTQFDRIREGAERQFHNALRQKRRAVKRLHESPSATLTFGVDVVGSASRGMLAGRHALNVTPVEQTSSDPIEHRANSCGRYSTKRSNLINPNETSKVNGSEEAAGGSVPTYDILSDDDEEATVGCPLSATEVASVSGSNLVSEQPRAFDFVCNVCNKAFALLAHLLVHRRNHARRPHKCSWCQKTFTRRSVLTDHLRTHTLEKPYRCRFCDKGFAKRWNAREHELIHSGVRRRSRGQVKEANL